MPETQTTEKAEFQKWKLIAVSFTLITNYLICLWAIYAINTYGIALFIFIPVLLGFMPVMILGRNAPLQNRQAFRIGLLTLLLFAAGLIIFAIEGVLCVLMCLPIAFIAMWLGVGIALYFVNKHPHRTTTILIILLTSTFTTGYMEKDVQSSVRSVTTTMHINASPEAVWENVIAFPKLDDPEELLFKTGIAYPTNATITGTGVGAVRHCNFSTGSFVEPITVWDAPNLLKFDVEQQPAPMKELSFWDIDAPHLHDFFASQRGQFKLIRQADGTTLLEGTTWYRNNIRPNFYWNIWSDYIIHNIHNRVLKHIKQNAERA